MVSFEASYSDLFTAMSYGHAQIKRFSLSLWFANKATHLQYVDPIFEIVPALQMSETLGRKRRPDKEGLDFKLLSFLEIVIYVICVLKQPQQFVLIFMES